MTRLFRLFLAIPLLLATAGATTITYVTPPNSTVGGVPVEAMATFTTGVNTLTIELQNLLTDQFTVAQGLSDIAFTLDSGTLAGALLMSSFSSGSATVSASGVETFGPGIDPTGWALDTSAGFDVCLICPAVNTNPPRPAHVLIGGLLNPNGSIAGNGPHSPFLTGTATFVLQIPEVTASTRVTSATFSFGTALGLDVPGTTDVPEPASMVVVGIGLISLGFLRRRQ